MSEEAVDSVFNNVCENVATEFKKSLKANLDARDLGTITVDPDCSCTVHAPLWIDEITFTGGVTRNIGMVKALEERLEKKLNVSEESHYMGALGAALFALDHILASRVPHDIAEHSVEARP